MDLKTISSSIANSIGNDLSGNLGTPSNPVGVASSSHETDDPTNNLSLYQMNASMNSMSHESEAPERPRRSKPRVVDAAEKVRRSYWNKGVSKVINENTI